MLQEKIRRRRAHKSDWKVVDQLRSLAEVFFCLLSLNTRKLILLKAANSNKYFNQNLALLLILSQYFCFKSPSSSLLPWSCYYFCRSLDSEGPIGAIFPIFRWNRPVFLTAKQLNWTKPSAKKKVSFSLFLPSWACFHLLSWHFVWVLDAWIFS